MASKTPKLSSPLRLGTLQLRNRNIMASLTRNRSVNDALPNEHNVEYYRQRAAGGAGLILSEGTLISPSGTEWPNAPGIWDKEHAVAWTKVTEAVHNEGGKMFCQLWHVGRVAHPDMEWQKRSGEPVWGPSAVAARGGLFRMLPGKPGYTTPTEIPDPAVIIEQYRKAAQFAKEAGFDGVELHSANGYLVNQFLDGDANQRRDKWGGSVENRTRFALEALKVLIGVWGKDRVGIKINPTGGYNDVGRPLDESIDLFSHLIKEINELGIAYIQLVRYVPIMDPKIDGKKRGIQHDVLATYRHLITNPSTKVFVNGEVTPTEAEELISKGIVDAAVFGKMWISNPDLQKRFEKGIEPNMKLDFGKFYAAPQGKEWMGYSDYPTAT